MSTVYSRYIKNAMLVFFLCYILVLIFSVLGMCFFEKKVANPVFISRMLKNTDKYTLQIVAKINAFPISAFIYNLL